MLENLFASRIDIKTKSRLVGLFPDNNFADNISFGGGCPDEQLFPAKELTAAYQDAVCRQMNHAFQYHDKVLSVCENTWQPELRPRWASAT